MVRKKVGVREIVRNPSLLKIAPDEVMEIEDRHSRTSLGLFIGTDMAREFDLFLKKRQMLESAEKIKRNVRNEYDEMEGALGDGLPEKRDLSDINAW